MVRHSYHYVLLDPPVRRPARSTIIITNIDTELVAVSSPHCGSCLDDYLPAAHVLGVPGVVAMRLELKGGA